jgi:hypothetical protein
MTPEPKNHVFLRSEIRDAITAAALTLALAGRAGATYPPGYVDGHMDALRTLAVALGIELPPQNGTVQR